MRQVCGASRVLSRSAAADGLPRDLLGIPAVIHDRPVPAQLNSGMSGIDNTQTHLRKEQVTEAAKGRVVGEVADALKHIAREAHQAWWSRRQTRDFFWSIRQKPQKLMIVQLEQRERKGDDGWEELVHTWVNEQWEAEIRGERITQVVHTRGTRPWPALCLQHCSIFHTPGHAPNLFPRVAELKLAGVQFPPQIRNLQNTSHESFEMGGY